MPSVLKVLTDHEFQKLINQEYRDEGGNIIIQDVYIHKGAVIEVAGKFYSVLKDSIPDLEKKP